MNESFRKNILMRIPEVKSCFQCGVCSGACPVAFAGDYSPREILRMINLGMDKAINSSTIWLCISCYLCTERCPMRIDVAKVMLTLRRISIEQEIVCGGIDIKPIVVTIDSEICSICKICTRICPYGAIEFDEKKQIIKVLDTLCKGCGLCVAACPSRVIKQPGFTDEEICAKIDELLL